MTKTARYNQGVWRGGEGGGDLRNNRNKTLSNRGKTERGNHRDIAARRFGGYCERAGILPEEQSDFQPNHFTADMGFGTEETNSAVNLLRRSHQKARLRRQNSLMGTHNAELINCRSGVLIMFHAIVILPMNLHLYKAEKEHAKFSPDQAQGGGFTGGRGKGWLECHLDDIRSFGV